MARTYCTIIRTRYYSLYPTFPSYIAPCRNTSWNMCRSMILQTYRICRIIEWDMLHKVVRDHSRFKSDCWHQDFNTKDLDPFFSSIFGVLFIGVFEVETKVCRGYFSGQPCLAAPGSPVSCPVCDTKTPLQREDKHFMWRSHIEEPIANVFEVVSRDLCTSFVSDRGYRSIFRKDRPISETSPPHWQNCSTFQGSVIEHQQAPLWAVSCWGQMFSSSANPFGSKSLGNQN